MKKALSLILALILCLSLCACGGNTNDLSSEEPSVVGEWKNQSSGMDLVLTPSGRGLKLNSKDCGNAITWEIYDGILYVYQDVGTVNGVSNRYVISGENLLDSDGDIVYTKK